MTQEELKQKLEDIIDYEAGWAGVDYIEEYGSESKYEDGKALKDLLDLVNQHVAEVIGEDEDPIYSHWIKSEDGKSLFKLNVVKNKLRAEQRKRANL